MPPPPSSTVAPPSLASTASSTFPPAPPVSRTDARVAHRELAQRNVAEPLGNVRTIETQRSLLPLDAQSQQRLQKNSAPLAQACGEQATG